MSTKEFGGTSTNTDAADTGVRKSSVEAKNVSSCNNVGETERDMSTNESGGTITDTDGLILVLKYLSLKQQTLTGLILMRECLPVKQHILERTLIPL